MYMRNEWHFRKNQLIEIEHYYPGNYGAPGMKRAEKRKRTPEEIKKQNERNRVKFLQRLILANFTKGDMHLILNYRPKDRTGYEQGKKDLRRFLSRMRGAYKKAGLQFKYIAVTEYGKKGHALHHHLIIQDIATDQIDTIRLARKLWELGHAGWTDLYEDGEYKKLAEYIVKRETKQENEWSSYTRSRNMIVPKPKRKKLYRRRWPPEPKPWKGYEIIKDSIINGENRFTGYPYQKYVMRKIEGGGKHIARDNLYRNNHPGTGKA